MATRPDRRRPLYVPRGGAFDLLHSQDPECLLSGPAGTGKSSAALFKLHLCCNEVPGVRALIVRKTRVSLTQSALVTLEALVIPDGHPAKRGASRAMRQSYHYPNGSELVVCGLDKPGKAMSSEYDLIFCQESIDISDDSWEALTTRLRNGVLGYQQLLGDTNPDRPTHWLKKRCDSGRTRLIDGTHQDNPVLWDVEANGGRGDWTAFARRPDGTGYIDRLDALTGPRYHRLRWGRWVQSEGVVYEGWEPATHLIDSFSIPDDWPRWWAIDFGFTHPFVCLWLARDPDGRLYVYRELHRTGLLVEDAARLILELSAGEPRPQAVLCDWDAEDRATLDRHLGGIYTTRAWKDVSPGIQAVATRLRPAGDGKPRLFVLRDSLVERDPVLDEKKLPCCLAEEVDGYVWNVAAGRAKGEEPVKENDDACDCLRYAIASQDCMQPMGDFVWLKTRPDPAPLVAPPPDQIQYPEHMRYFAPSGGYQPWIDLPSGTRLSLCDFRSESEAAYALHLAREWMALPPPGFGRPQLEPAEAARAEKRLREFLTRARLL